jgi:hypothetical protein
MRSPDTFVSGRYIMSASDPEQAERLKAPGALDD